MLYEYLKRENFACKCGCGFDAVDIELFGVLKDIERHFKHHVHLNSACRCLTHNADVGGAIDSQHLKAKAGDITVETVQPSIVAEYLEQKYPDKYGIGRYNAFTHIDVRPVMARW